MLNKQEYISENLEKGDLKRLVHPELHIDQYKSKMGDDADVCVISFKVAGKEPSTDLVSFLEKGYDFVLDADVSSGEKEGGDYLVFVEMDRTEKLPEQIVKIIEDLENLTEHKLEDWRVRYYRSTTDNELSVQSLRDLVPLTPEQYAEKYPDTEINEPEVADQTAELDSLKTAAGIPVTTVAPTNEYTESLRVAAGIK